MVSRNFDTNYQKALLSGDLVERVALLAAEGLLCIRCGRHSIPRTVAGLCHRCQRATGELPPNPESVHSGTDFDVSGPRSQQIP